MSTTTVKFVRNNKNSKCLTKREGDAGYDLSSVEEYDIQPRTRLLVNVGLNVEVPSDYYLQIFPRSSMACAGIDTGAGVIDSSYRGKVKVLLINNTDLAFHINVGDRIAQAVLIHIGNSTAVERASLTESKRGEGGFGSTGK